MDCDPLMALLIEREPERVPVAVGLPDELRDGRGLLGMYGYGEHTGGGAAEADPVEKAGIIHCMKC